ncbi:MAG: prohibitin family protein [Methylococcaceae bacterium]|nr:prohibitin family protein [Methylococcaceae bacterium]
MDARIGFIKKSLLSLGRLIPNRLAVSAFFGFFKNGIVGSRDWVRDKLPYFAVFLLVSVLSLAFFWPQIVITINSGEGGVLYKRFFGTVTDKVYTEGIHVIFPWDTMYIYNGRIQTVLHDFDVLTNQGLPIHLSLAIRFNPEYEMLGLLHQQVGPDYINTIIAPEVESVLRKRLSPYKPEEIYMNKDNILTQVVLESIEELGKKYVTANDVIIREISLPDTIREAIESKLTEEQKEQAYAFRIKSEKSEAERKRIEAEGIKDYQNTVSKTLTDKLLKWQGIQATVDLAKSNNSKIVVIGSGNTGMPLILGSERSNKEAPDANKENPEAQDKKPAPVAPNISAEPANEPR